MGFFIPVCEDAPVRPSCRCLRQRAVEPVYPDTRGRSAVTDRLAEESYIHSLGRGPGHHAVHAQFIGKREDAAGLPSLDHLAHTLAFVVEEGDWDGHRASVVIRVFHFHQVGGGRVWQFDLIGKPGERGRPLAWSFDLLDFRAGAVVAFAVFAGCCLVDPRLAVRLEKLGGINRLPHVRIGNAIDVVDQGFALDLRVRPGLDVYDSDLADAELARA